MPLNDVSDVTHKLTAVEQELILTVQELTDTYEEISAIHRFSETLGAEIKTEVLCDKIASEVRDTLEVSTVSIMLLDMESGDLITTAYQGHSSDESRAYRLKPGQGLPWHVINTRKSLIVCDVRMHPAHISSPHTTTSLMAAPLFTKDKILGVIVASDKLNKSEFFSNELKLLTTIANQASIAIENSNLYANLENLFVGIVRSFAAALDAKSAWTAGHSERVTTYSVAIGEELGVEKAFLEDIRNCGLLHDVGKIGIPERILDKREGITTNEYSTIRQHTLKGAQILEHIDTFKTIIPGIKHHHERWDGLGSPEGLKGDTIPLIARILAVADSYDAITSNRPYRKKRDKKEAVEEIKRCSGSQFDPRIVHAFLNAVDKQLI